MNESVTPDTQVPLSAERMPHVAKVYGEPLTQIPLDLYIPPEALEIFLDAFEGPLDLLLYLIRKHNLDVLDIPMADLTRQYMEYVDVMRVKHLELAAEYLVMAAWLIEIKSRLLLPRPEVAVSDQDNDPRAELARKLLEYEQMKLAAARMDKIPLVGRDFSLVSVWIEELATKRLPLVDMNDLAEAWLEIVRRAKITGHHHRITRDELSVREYMSNILRDLKGREFVEFTELFTHAQGVSVLVVTFLALLELVRERMVAVTQEQAYAPIYVRLNDGTDTGNESGLAEGIEADSRDGAAYES